MRLTSLPSSIVHTNVCPASLRTAVAGSDGTGALAASAMRPVANMPPRSAASGSGCRRNTRIARVPGSVGRIDALDAPGEAALAEAVDRELDRHADRELRDVDRGHHRLQLHLRQVDDGDERRVERDLLAGLHVALGDDAGQRRRRDRILQRVLGELHLRFGRLHAALRRRSRLDSELSNAFCEMKFCFRSFWLVASVLSAIASCAFADSSCALALDQLGLEVGGVDPHQHLARLHRRRPRAR